MKINEEIKTLGDLETIVPKLIANLCKVKGLDNWKPYYLGWDWYSHNGDRYVQLEISIEFLNSQVRTVNVCLPNALFIADGVPQLDIKANLTMLDFDNKVSLRITYLIYLAIKWAIKIDLDSTAKFYIIANKLGNIEYITKED